MLVYDFFMLEHKCFGISTDFITVEVLNVVNLLFLLIEQQKKEVDKNTHCERKAL